MSNINKQALRSKARSASAGEWIKESGDGWEAICSTNDQANGNFIIAHFEGPDAKANREFAQAAQPDVVLALLDEISELEQKHCGTALLEREESHAKKVGRLLNELEAAEKRIAALEAREVVLPAAWWVKQGPQSLLAYEKGMLLDALSAAGIITKVGE